MRKELHSAKTNRQPVSTFTPAQLNDIIHKRNVDKILLDSQGNRSHKLSKLAQKARYTRKTLLQIRESKMR